jgi:mRNA interferase RelE/StbE
MTLFIPPDVLEQLAAVPRADRRRLREALEMVAAAPANHFSFATQLVGRSGAWRLRKGDWRAFYRIREGDVIVEQVGNRKDIYR